MVNTQPHTINGIKFSGSITPPGSTDSLFLAGSGPRYVNATGELIVLTAIAIYLHEVAVKTLAVKWKGKSIDELNDSPQFFEDVYAGKFEWLTRVAMVNQRASSEFTEKMMENFVDNWKAVDVYNDDKPTSTGKFRESLKYQVFPYGSSVLYDRKVNGTLCITFALNSTIPEKPSVVIDNNALGEEILKSIIGEHGVSPDAKESLATHMFALMSMEGV